MDLFKILLLSLIEGLTEFIPVSSTGHMLILNNLFAEDEAVTDVFIIFIQLGAILAAVIVYWERFLMLLPRKTEDIQKVLYSPIFPSFTHIFLAIFPVMLGGLIFYHDIKTVLFNSYTVSITLVLGGVAMILAEKLCKEKIATIEQITPLTAFYIGLFQCFALIPGVSRSGSTIIGSLLLGVKLRPAVDFSFIIAAPVISAAVIYDLYKNYAILSIDDIPSFLTGFVASFIFAFLSIRWFLKILTKLKLTTFGIYRIILGVVVFLLHTI